MISKGALLTVVMMLCGLWPDFVDRIFTQRQMASSSLPLVIDLAGPFIISLVISTLLPKSVPLRIALVVLGSATYLIGDTIVIFHVRQYDQNMWPVEMVMRTGLAAAMLSAGAVVGSVRRNGARDLD